MMTVKTKAKAYADVSSERREFLRIPVRRPIKIRLVQEGDETLRLGTSMNVSQSGILFQTTLLPRIASIVWMELDGVAIEACHEIENHALIYNEGYWDALFALKRRRNQAVIALALVF